MKQFITSGLLVAGMIAITGCSGTKEIYLAKGNKSFDSGKYEDASLNYRKAIQKDSNFGEAYYRLGLAAVKLEQAGLAYEALFRATQLAPDSVAVKEKFADVCLSLYLADPSRPQALYLQITNLADKLLASNANSYEGLILKAYLASTDGKLEQAIEFFRKALRIDASNAGVVTELAQVLIRDGQTQAGEQLALDLISRHRTSYGPVYDLLYNVYLKSSQTSDAENVLKAKVSNNPQSAAALLQLARHYHRVRKYAEMQSTLQRLVDDTKTFPKAQLLAGDFYLGIRDYPQAINYYQDGAATNPDAKVKVVYETRNVVALLGQGKKEEATQLAEQIVKENPKADDAIRLHADLLLESGKPENAGAAIREFEYLSNQRPADASLRLQLGKAYRLNRDLPAARNQMVEAISKQKDLIAARFELAEISLLLQQPVETLRQTNEILRLHADDRRARLLRTRALAGTGDGAAARAELLRLIKEAPQDSEPHLQLGFLALAEHNYAEAVDILNRERASGDPRAFVGLAAAHLHQKQFDAAHQTLDEALKKWPDSIELLEQLGDTEAVSGHYDRAIGYYQRLLAIDPKSVEVNRRLVEVSELIGDQANALHYARQAHELAPDDPRNTLVLAAALARLGRIDEAKAQYENAVKLNPENAPALNNAAYFLADSGGDLDEALRLAHRAITKSPNQPDFSDTIGYIYLKKGWQDSAIQTFRNLERQYPSYASCRYHLGLALYEKGDRRAARQELESALGRHPSADDRLRIQQLLKKIG